jgi:alpha-N-arabinofuranosidase
MMRYSRAHGSNTQNGTRSGAAGMKQATGEMLSSPAIDSVNTFEAPTTVAPQRVAVQSSGGKVVLKLAPHSVAVVALEN